MAEPAEAIYQISAYVRPHKLEEVKSAIAVHPITGMSISDVRGSGNNPEAPSSLGGHPVVVPLPVKSRVVIVVTESLKDLVIQAIVNAAFTGAPGDGKVFVEPILDALRIRTSERGPSVV